MGYSNIDNNKKVFRDPVYELIFFDQSYDKVLIKIINSYEFQRLRRIRQLGLSFYTYPSAVHDRFAHSLGVAYNIGLIVDQLKIDENIKVNDGDSGLEGEITKSDLKLLLQIAALLHDVGHGPFSHAFEKVTKVDHEEVSMKIIGKSDGNISSILDELASNYSQFSKIKTWLKDLLSTTFRPEWINQLISSQLDADRLDYLLRDAYMCGVKYATFDLKWLYHNIEIAQIPEIGKYSLVINAEKGIYSLESFIISRYHMYEQVYFHKTTRCFELIMQAIVKRVNKLILLGKVSDLGNTDPNLIVFLKDNDNLDAFLKLDDFRFVNQIGNWMVESKDKILKELCTAFIERDTYKLYREVENGQLMEGQEYMEIYNAWNQDDRKDYFFLEDTSKNVIYKDQYLTVKPNEDTSKQIDDIKTKERRIFSNSIYLKTHKGEIKELAQVSPFIDSVRNKVFQKRRAYIKRSELSLIN